MTKSFAQVVSFALAAIATAATVAGANSMATQQYARAEAVVAIDQAPVLAMQRVVIVGHRT